MRITFFGTSHGVPEAHRRCSSALITLGSGENARRYIIDMGLNAIDEMRTRNLPVDSVKAVFIPYARRPYRRAHSIRRSVQLVL